MVDISASNSDNVDFPDLRSTTSSDTGADDTSTGTTGPTLGTGKPDMAPPPCTLGVKIPQIKTRSRRPVSQNRWAELGHARGRNIHRFGIPSGESRQRQQQWCQGERCTSMWTLRQLSTTRHLPRTMWPARLYVPEDRLSLFVSTVGDGGRPGRPEVSSSVASELWFPLATERASAQARLAKCHNLLMYVPRSEK